MSIVWDGNLASTAIDRALSEYCEMLSPGYHNTEQYRYLVAEKYGAPARKHRRVAANNNNDEDSLVNRQTNTLVCDNTWVDEMFDPRWSWHLPSDEEGFVSTTVNENITGENYFEYGCQGIQNLLGQSPNEGVWEPSDYHVVSLENGTNRTLTTLSNHEVSSDSTDGTILQPTASMRGCKRQREPNSDMESDNRSNSSTSSFSMETPAGGVDLNVGPVDIDYSRTVTKNPFVDRTGYTKHARLSAVARSKRHQTDNVVGGVINGLLKFRLVKKTGSANDAPQDLTDNQCNKKNMDFLLCPMKENMNNPLHYLPADFGRGMKLESGDFSLLRFFLLAICSGRTLLPNSNPYLRDVAAIASGSECVKHALLALSASYVLDYMDDRFTAALTIRADAHHKRAVKLLDMELKNQETYVPGKEDAVLAALILLSHDDIVNWEASRARDGDPKWYRGIKAAKLILDVSDPGRRFNNPAFVQSTLARRSLQNYFGMFDILSTAVAPLRSNESSEPYKYLLEGSLKDVTKIEGVTGMCSRLLYIFGQTTWLAAKLNSDPTSTALLASGDKLLNLLDDLQQWSELSPGHSNARLLLESCTLDEKGYVTTALEANELHAESYIQAAKIYLHCRVFRKPREHPDVRHCLKILLKCIRRCPTSGPLMTAQSPFFSTFIAGLVAITAKQRGHIRKWFEDCCSGPRGCVPPAWKALQYVWEWREKDNHCERSTSSNKIYSEETESWWEELVEIIYKKNGPLALA